MFMTGKVCCFTGHRPSKLKLPESEVCKLLECAIEQALSDGFTTFCTGMAPGTDVIAAEIILRLRIENPKLRLVCAMPCRGFGRHWKDGWSERMQNVLAQADEVEYICYTSSRSSYQRRNEFMVDHSSRVIALYNGTKGGTKNTIDYAHKKGVPCIIIDAK